jgi:hypothetical protein
VILRDFTTDLTDLLTSALSELATDAGQTARDQNWSSAALGRMPPQSKSPISMIRIHWSMGPMSLLESHNPTPQLEGRHQVESVTTERFGIAIPNFEQFAHEKADPLFQRHSSRKCKDEPAPHGQSGLATFGASGVKDTATHRPLLRYAYSYLSIPSRGTSTNPSKHAFL